MTARAGVERPRERGLTEQLAEALCAAQHSDRDYAKAKQCIVDLLSGAFASRDLPWSRQALTLIAGDGMSPCSILGSAQRAAPADAVFVNAVMSHGLVRDDMHLGSVSHLGATIIPTVLALAQTQTITGRRLLAAMIGGYEAGGRLGRAVLDVDVVRVHRPTGITGPFAAAAAGSLALGLGPDTTAAALALAANTAAGYNEWAATGGSEMYFHAGFAARNALAAIELARAGAYCSPTALEGNAGLLAAFGKQDASALQRGPGGEAEIQSVFFKEVPACNYAQSPAQAARALALGRPFAPDDIATVVARVPFASAHYPGCDAAGPFEHVLQAKMSIQYNVAAALLTGRFDEASYVPTEQPRIAALARKVGVEVDETLTRAYPTRQAAAVIVTLKNGQHVEHAVADVAPASGTLIRKRFIEAASARLGNERANQLLAAIDSLESSDDAARLVALAQPDPAAAI
jgi:2-methylcitrate dehydratase PrpD